jgi:tellurite resistance protein TehA-like permease
LLAAYLLRRIRHREEAVADLRNPVVGALYGTVPGGLLVRAVMTSVIGPSVRADPAQQRESNRCHRSGAGKLVGT